MEGFLTLVQSAKLTRKANLLMRKIRPKKAELSCRWGIECYEAKVHILAWMLRFYFLQNLEYLEFYVVFLDKKQTKPPNTLYLLYWLYFHNVVCHYFEYCIWIEGCTWQQHSGALGNYVLILFNWDPGWLGEEFGIGAVIRNFSGQKFLIIRTNGSSNIILNQRFERKA